MSCAPLYRASASRDNPWDCLHLAEALEQGEGTERNAAQALDLYRAVAAQDREPDAKRQAREALTRLGPATAEPVAPPPPR